MQEQFIRTQMLIGEHSIHKLTASKVIVFGIGGVGGYVCEALARSGVAKIDVVDNDTVALSNINRQIIATHKTLGKYKVDVIKQRMLDINPNMEVNSFKTFYMPENADDFDLSKYDYVIDAIDTVTAKLELIVRAEKANVPIISAMGAGNKLNPLMFEVTDIYKTSMCPLAKVMRRELKARGIKKLKVVYSKEEAIKPLAEETNLIKEDKRRSTPGSIAFVPSVAGLIMAGEVVKDIINK